MTVALVTSYFVNKNTMTDGRKACQLCLQLYYETIFSEFFDIATNIKILPKRKFQLKVIIKER